MNLTIGELVESLKGLVSNIVAFVVMLILAITTFFITVFVIDVGAGLAGYEDLSGDFVVLSATILVASTILAGIMKE